MKLQYAFGREGQEMVLLFVTSGKISIQTGGHLPVYRGTSAGVRKCACGCLFALI